MHIVTSANNLIQRTIFILTLARFSFSHTLFLNESIWIVLKISFGHSLVLLSLGGSDSRKGHKQTISSPRN